MASPLRRTLPAAALSLALLSPVAFAGPAFAAPVAVSHGNDHHAAHAVHAARSPFTAAEVTSTATTWTVTWTTAAHTPVNVLLSTDGGTHWKVVAVGVTRGSFATAALSGIRPWFRLSTRAGAPLDVTTRSLGLASVSNLRDAGGYRTTDGKWVRMGVLYRSNALTTSAADGAVVASLGIREIYDFRTSGEIATSPDVVPAGARDQNLNVLGDISTGITATTAAEASAYMAQGEVQMVDSASAKAAYAAFFTDLATTKGAQLYHCTAGKDRTGWASAVLLTLLGVDQKTVMDDYLLSNTYYYDSPAIQGMLAQLPAAQRAVYEQFMLVKPEYLQAGLDQVKAEYGSMDNYVEKGLGVSPKLVKQLKQRLLTNPVD